MVITKEQEIEIEKIEKASCEVFGAEVESIYKKTSKHDASMARAFVFYMLHEDLKISVGCICKRYKRGSNAVFKSLSKTKYRVEKMHAYKEMYLDICNAKK